MTKLINFLKTFVKSLFHCESPKKVIPHFQFFRDYTRILQAIDRSYDLLDCMKCGDMMIKFKEDFEGNHIHFEEYLVKLNNSWKTQQTLIELGLISKPEKC